MLYKKLVLSTKKQRKRLPFGFTHVSSLGNLYFIFFTAGAMENSTGA